jgi:hypothetical protein
MRLSRSVEDSRTVTQAKIVMLKLQKPQNMFDMEGTKDTTTALRHMIGNQRLAVVSRGASVLAKSSLSRAIKCLSASGLFPPVSIPFDFKLCCTGCLPRHHRLPPLLLQAVRAALPLPLLLAQGARDTDAGQSFKQARNPLLISARFGRINVPLCPFPPSRMSIQRPIDVVPPHFTSQHESATGCWSASYFGRTCILAFLVVVGRQAAWTPPRISRSGR